MKNYPERFRHSYDSKYDPKLTNFRIFAQFVQFQSCKKMTFWSFNVNFLQFPATTMIFIQFLISFNFKKTVVTSCCWNKISYQQQLYYFMYFCHSAVNPSRSRNSWNWRFQNPQNFSAISLTKNNFFLLSNSTNWGSFCVSRLFENPWFYP